MPHPGSVHDAKQARHGSRFSSPKALAEEALCEAQARIKRSAVERTRTILEAERRYVADLESVVSHLRGVTAQISGVEVAA
jgi:hypothetical protein